MLQPPSSAAYLFKTVPPQGSRGNYITPLNQAEMVAPAQSVHPGTGAVVYSPGHANLPCREPGTDPPFLAAAAARERTALLAGIKSVADDQPETQIVVEVIWFVPVAVGAAGVVTIVVPGAAPHHPPRQRPAPIALLFFASHPAGGRSPPPCRLHIHTDPG